MPGIQAEACGMKISLLLHISCTSWSFGYSLFEPAQAEKFTYQDWIMSIVLWLDFDGITLYRMKESIHAYIHGTSDLFGCFALKIVALDSKMLPLSVLNTLGRAIDRCNQILNFRYYIYSHPCFMSHSPLSNPTMKYKVGSMILISDRPSI